PARPTGWAGPDPGPPRRRDPSPPAVPAGRLQLLRGPLRICHGILAGRPGGASWRSPAGPVLGLPYSSLRPRLVGPPDRRPDARHVVGLPRARLGRLLGLGPGRGRGPDALARHHRVPAHRARPGAAGGAVSCLGTRPGGRGLPPLRV